MVERLHGDIIRAYFALKDKIIDISIQDDDDRLYATAGDLEKALGAMSRGRGLENLPSREFGVPKEHLDIVRNIAAGLRDGTCPRLIEVGQAMLDLCNDHYATIESNPHQYLKVFSLIGYDASSLPLFKNGTSYSKVR